MLKTQDMVGQTYNNWKILNISEFNKNNRHKYLDCECIECGNKKTIRKDNVAFHKPKCEICYQKYLDSQIGKRFGFLVVISYSHKSKNNEHCYNCLCDCGNTTITDLHKLQSQNTTSCGCYGNACHTKHGQHGTRIYNIYLKMKSRCYCINIRNYSNYGGRGIYVCDEWLDEENGFINFYNWSIENGYTDELSIDRKDNNGPYAPWNCRWVTMDIQQNNRRSNRHLHLYGEKLTISQISKKYNIKYGTLLASLNRNNKSIYQILNLPFNSPFIYTNNPNLNLLNVNYDNNYNRNSPFTYTNINIAERNTPFSSTKIYNANK